MDTGNGTIPDRINVQERMGGQVAESSRPRSVLRMAQVGMCYNRHWVLKDVELQVLAGSIHAVIGHNGAGKSTLMKIAFGALRPTEGDVLIGDQALTYRWPAEACRLGVGMVTQESTLVETMTGLDNIFLNAELRHAGVLVDAKREVAEIAPLIERLRIAPSTLGIRVSEMSPVERKLIEIARALRLGKRLLVLDEPTVPFGASEIEMLLGVLRAAAADAVGVILITHHLSEVFAAADTVTCLREGRVVLSCPTARTSMDELESAMVGDKPMAKAARTRARVASDVTSRAKGEARKTPALKISHLQAGAALQDLSLEIFAGEIVGIVGRVGSGRTTLLRSLFGDVRLNRGTLSLFGETYRPGSPADALARGVSLVSESRATHGLMSSKSVAENILLPSLSRFTNRFGFLRSRVARLHALDVVRSLQIRFLGLDQTIQELSGGNQQKINLAKVLSPRLRLLLLDEPTAGVDPATARQIKSIVRRIADGDVPVLWASSQVLETIEFCDRIAVLRNGAVVMTVAREDRVRFEENFITAVIQNGTPAGHAAA